MKKQTLICSLAIAACCVQPVNAGMITKCQDAQGTWHYGDNASEECAESTWTELNDRGVVVQEEVVPPSAEEIRAQREREEAAQRAEEEQKAKEREWNRMIAIYDSEEYIIQTRDNRLENISEMIEVNEQLLKRLHATLQNYMSMSGEKAQAEADKTREQIMAFETDNRAKNAEKKKIVETYSELLKRFREAKQRLKDKELAQQASAN